MRIFKMLLVAFTAVFFMLSTAGAEGVKIGIIDSQKILNTSVSGQAAKVELNKKGEELTNDLKGKEAEILKLQEKLEREALVMSAEMKDEKEREFRIKVGDFKAMEKKAKQEMGDLNMKIMAKIQNDVISIIEDLGKKGGFTVILERGTLLYAGGAVDISDEVIKLYDAKSKK
ncbi:MAG: OmpH family outer membrane protein [Proteobacteria bacterium]|nr:OmpH family outer membrane protein [Pseudomonadota bacterium]